MKSLLAQVGQPRAEADDKPLAQVERLKQQELYTVGARFTGRVTLTLAGIVVMFSEASEPV
ncbi:MAG TPA: hypothetical protein VNM37_08715 [Candidatus Dormibacteraeota bacterium]|nr:hypothetical protein [Candidatus Dormibacteraeota bacterium]